MNKMTPLKMCKLPNPIMTVMFCNWTFALDSGIFSDNIDENSKEHPLFYKISDQKRTKSVIYDNINNVFIANYHDKVVHQDQKLFAQQQNKYYLDWLESLGNQKAKEMFDILNKVSLAQKTGYDISLHYSSKVPKTCSDRIILKALDQKFLEDIKKRAYVIRLHVVKNDNESS